MIRYSGITDEEEGSTAYSNAANVLQNGLADEYAHDHDQAYLKNEYEVNLKSNPKLAKQAILENGIIGTSFYWDSKYLANDGKSFYNGTENKTNHAVAIVGWDDDYSRTNFKTDPGENGAWLIRNSWTTIPAFSSYSYFWISYKDTSLNSTAYVYEIADRDRGEVYDNNYYYDSQLHNTCSAPSGKVANVFTAQKTSEELKAVSLDITSPYSAAIDYTIRVYRGLTDVSDPESGTLMDTVTGTLPFAGRYTIPLNSAISLTRDECFSIVVDTGSDRIDRECDFLWNNQINMDTNINSGESFYYEGGSWKDMILRSSGGNYGNACIRALTNNTTSELPTKIVSLSTAGITSDSVILKWSAAKNADSYQILRASGDGDYAVVQTVSAGVRKYEDTGLTALTDYKYKVCPVRDGVTSWDDVSPELAVRTKPGIPELTMANVGGYCAMVTWTEVKGCDGYEIRWRSSGYNGYTYFQTNETEYRIRNLTPESEYTVEVYPYTGSESPLNYSSPGSTVFSTGTGNPVAVGNLRAEPYSTSAIMLTWEVPEDVSTIRVEKSEDNGISYSLLGSGRYSYNTKSYYVSNLNNTTKYTFRVTAVYTEDNAGNPVIKAVSEPVSAYAKLPGVKNLKVTSSFEDKSMTVTWSGVANAAYYAVYRKMSSESEYIPLGIVPAGGVLSYTDTTIVPGRYYFYRVFGCRENVLTDEQGTIVSSYGEMIELDPVENVNTDVRSTSAAVTWDTVSGADSYVIEQYADNSWNEFITILGGQTNEAALTGLSPKTYYRFRMHAESEDGAISVSQSGDNIYIAYTYLNFTTTDDGRGSLSKSDFSFVSSSYTYDGQPHSAGITTDIEEVAAAGLTFAYAPVTNGTAGSFTGSVPVNAGTWQIKIQTPQTGNYKAATLTDPEWRFTIKRAPLTVTANACTITYGEAPKGNGVSYSGFAGSDTAAVLGGTLTFSYDYKKYDDAGGSYTITPGGLVSDNYEISYVSGKLTVNKKETGLDWSSVPLIYNGMSQVPSVSVTGLVNNDQVSATVTGAEINAGSGYTAVAVTLTGAKAYNYKLPSANTHTFAIGRAVYTGAKTASDLVRGGQVTTNAHLSLPDLPEGASYAASGTVGGTKALILSHSVSGSVLTYSTSSREDNTSATITIGVSGAINYEDYSVVVTITTKARDEALVTLNGGKDKKVTYGASDFTLTAQAENEGKNAVWTWTSSDNEVASAGEHTGKISIGKAGTAVITARYESDTTIGTASITLTVDKKPLVVKWSDTYFVYDGNAHIPSALLMNLENGDICTVSVSGGQVKAGTYKATASITGEDSGNYELGNGDAECDFTIAKAGMSGAVITLSQGLTYNGTEQTQTVTGVRVNGLLLDPADYSVTGNKGTNAGQYTLTVTARDNSDYTGTAAKSFTIAKKAIIPFVCVTGTYSYTGSAITPSYYVKDGSAYLALSDYSVTVTDNINAGQGLITVKAAEGGNYSFSDVKRYFDIGKALHGDEQVSLDVKSGTGGYGELKRYMEAGGSLGAPVIISGQDVFDEMPSVSGTVLIFTIRTDNGLAGREAVMKIPVNGADNYLPYYITVTVKVLQNDSYADIIEELRKDDDNKDIQVSSNTVRKDDGSTDTTITVGGKDVSKVTVDTDGRITEETNIWISGLKSRYHYTGASVTPGISVFDGTKKLTEGTDYSLKYKNNKAVGRSAEMILTFKGNYATTEQQILTFEISPAVIGTDVMIEDMTITGNDRLQKPVPTIIMKATGKKLPKKNFEFVYKNSDDDVVDGVTEAGEYTVTVTAANGNFVDGKEDTAARITVKDKPHQIMGATVKLREGEPKKFVYTGKAIIPGAGRYILTIKDGRKNIELTEDLDYTVEYSNNTDPGNALVTFKGMGDYAGTKQTTFRIEKGRMLNDNDDITVEFADGAETVPYAKGGAVPGVIVRDRNTVLIMGRDYTVSYAGNKAVTDGAEAAVSIRGKGNYKGEIARRFSIVKQDIGNLKDGIFVSDKVKTKKSDWYKKPAVTITDLDGKKLKEKTDYEICDDYEVLDDGYVKVTIKAADNGNYKEKVSVTYRCLDADKMLSKAKVMKNIEIQTYTGSEIMLSEDDLTGILYMGNKRSPDLLIPGEDFEVLSYSGNIKKGTAKVTLKGIGEYGGTKTLNFKIKAKKGIYTGVIRDGSW